MFETHIPFSLATSFWENVGFEAAGVMEANGHFDGIWVLVRKVGYRYQLIDIFYQSVTSLEWK